jgi:uncharacterized membrane protein (DUF373 family)
MEKNELEETVTDKAGIFLKLVNSLLVVVISLVLLFALGMLSFDIYKMLVQQYSEGIGTVLGSLLIVWVVLELLEAQINHLRGEKMNASIFLVVAIVAFIKKLLIAALIPSNVEYAYFTLAVIVILTITYLILRFAETRL